MDNSPRFDIQKPLFAIEYSCFMANETRYMKKIAEELGDSESASYFEEWHNNISKDINDTLWCEEDGFYYDVIASSGEFHKISSVASFLPIFSGVCSEKQAELLYKELKNPETFYTEFPIPCISKKDATFGSDMWRGPVWINYNYMISEGLEEYGFKDYAQEIIQKTIDTLGYWYQKRGTIFEYYDSKNSTPPDELNRKGKPIEPYNFEAKMQTIREYGWSNTLLFDILHNKYFG
jgi:neutral trehalase